MAATKVRRSESVKALSVGKTPRKTATIHDERPKMAARSKKNNEGIRPAEGDNLPLAELLDQDGTPVSLSSFRGKNLVLYFYPKDDTPGCTREACCFQEKLSAFKKAKVVVVGVSADPVQRHRKFADKYGLSFPLLVDENKQFAAACGVIGEKVLYGKRSVGIVRTTFVVDKAGTIRRVFRKVKVDGHTDEVLAAIKAMG